MPPVIAAVAAVAAGAAIATSATVIAAVGAFGASLLGAAASIAVSFVGNAIIGKPKSPTSPLAEIDNQGRSINVRQPVAKQRLIVGQQKIGGVTVFVATSDWAGKRNILLHVVVALSGHEVEEVGEFWFDDIHVPMTLLPDGIGLVPSSGPYAGRDPVTDAQFVTMEKYRGTSTQAASARLIGHCPEWTAAHQGRGIAYWYGRFYFSPDIFPNGLPTITVEVKGKKWVDPRTGTEVWTDNWAAVMSGWIKSPKWGVGAANAEFDDTELIAEANACDEMVDVVAEVYGGLSDGVTLQVDLRHGERRPLIGDRFAIPGSAAPLYVSYAQTGGIGCYLRFAASLATARAGAAVSIASGSMNVARTGEPRYTANGIIDAGTPRRETLDALRSAAQGSIINAGGVWRVLCAVWRAPTVTLDEGDLRGPIRIKSLQSRRDIFNTVTGTFVDPSQAWQPVPIPTISNDTYVAADNGEEISEELNRPFTISPSMAQRLNKIALEKTRREIEYVAPLKLKAFEVATLDAVNVDFARYGWSDKSFECQSWGFAQDQDASGNPVLGVDFSFRELDANAFVWSSDEETPLPAALRTNLPSPFDVAAPGVPDVTEEQYETRAGRGVAVKAIVTWSDPTAAFTELYQPEYRLVGATDWTVLPRQASTIVEILDLAPGTYDFRVKAVSTLGVSSTYATSRKEIVGLGARPADVTGLTAAVISSIAHLQWDAHPDLDVRIGGYFRVRWSPAASGATWDTAVDVGERVAGNITFAFVAAETGTYLVKAADSSGNLSENAATVVVTAGSHFAFTTLSTITESPTFPGTKTSVAVDSSKLHLTGNTLFDDIADVDAVTDLDLEGGISESGAYLFNSGYDKGSVATLRVAFSATVAVVNTLDTVDSRGALVDDWEDWDGAVTASAGVRFYVRQTDDDPAVSPTWSDWQRVAPIGDFHARALEFKAELFTDDPAYDVEIAALSVTIKGV